MWETILVLQLRGGGDKEGTVSFALGSFCYFGIWACPNDTCTATCQAMLHLRYSLFLLGNTWAHTSLLIAFNWSGLSYFFIPIAAVTCNPSHNILAIYCILVQVSFVKGKKTILFWKMFSWFYCTLCFKQLPRLNCRCHQCLAWEFNAPGVNNFTIVFQTNVC